MRRLLFALDPERAHGVAILALRLAGRLPPLARGLRRRYAVDDARLSQGLAGLEFANPVGLAAGFDKNGVALRGLTTIGFGFLEVGTVTPRAQPGNPRPRIFRHPEARSLQNSLGFNNAGLDAMRRRLAAGRGARPVPIGVNLGRNKTTPQSESAADYLKLLDGLAGLADYFVVNVSSPNTPGLRDLQEASLVSSLVGRARRRVEQPLFVKLSPDLEPEVAVALGRAAVDAGAAGLILTNTTTDYGLLPGARPLGGLSGGVLRRASRRSLEAVAGELFGECVLVSVGGIDSADEAYRRLRAGASLVQLYTGLVFEGPSLVRRINRGLAERLEVDAARSVREIVGADLNRVTGKKGGRG